MNNIKILVVGGGTAGWLAASYLKKTFDIEVELVESKNVPKLGVGESVTPHVVNFLMSLGVDEKHFMEYTGSIWKYANLFKGWTSDPNHTEYFSFNYPIDRKFLYKENSFANKMEDWVVDKDSYTTLEVMMKLLGENKLDKFDRHYNTQHHFMENLTAPFNDGVNLLNPILSWTHHVNAERLADYIRDNVGLPAGVKHTYGHVVDFKLKGENQIEHIVLDDGKTLTGDLIVDATGFSRVIVGKMLNWNVRKFSTNPIDSVWVCQLDYDTPETEILNYTRTTAQPYGWMFNIPLYHRQGCGYCFSTSYTTKEKALDRYLSLTKNHKFEPRNISWEPNMLETMAKGNVVAIGLSCGFIEPMEANALFTITNSIRRLHHVVRGYRNTGEWNFDTYNEVMNYCINDIADFIKIHYTLSNRTDTDFWKDMGDIGRRENHVDLVREKYQNQKHSMEFTKEGWTLFPSYMYAQVAHSWGVDISDWNDTSIDDTTMKLGELHFKHLNDKFDLVARSSENYYQSIKRLVFNDLSPTEWKTKYNI